MKISLINIKRLIIFCFIHACLLSSVNVYADECGVLQLQNNRSSGISISRNKCITDPYISMGTVINLSAKGRLWLRSNLSSSTPVSEFQMICQNRTASSLQLEFSDMVTPWLNQAKLKNCSGWIENKLSCDGQMGEKKGLYCVLSFFKTLNRNKTTQIERTTSVKMRDVKLLLGAKNSSSKLAKKELLEAIIPELKLCKKLNQLSNYMQIGWRVDQNAAKQEINIVSTVGLGNYALSECVKTVVITFPYPKFQGQLTFSTSF